MRCPDEASLFSVSSLLPAKLAFSSRLNNSTTLLHSAPPYLSTLIISPAKLQLWQKSASFASAREVQFLLWIIKIWVEENAKDFDINYAITIYIFNKIENNFFCAIFKETYFFFLWTQKLFLHFFIQMDKFLYLYDFFY